MDDKWGVGDKKDEKAFATTMVGEQKVELIFGEYPHSKWDSTIYARFPGGSIEGFDGHRLLHEIKFKDYNYLKESELSGNEVRKGGNCEIIINGYLCATFFYRDIMEALFNCRSMIQKVHDCPVHLWDEDDRKKLKGRKIYYREFPAVIDYLIDDQACIIIKPEPPTKIFPPTAYQLEDAKESEHDFEDRNIVKAEIWDPHIWWWRK